MPVYLSHMSAIDFWRVVYSADRSPGPASHDTQLSDAPCRLRELKAIRAPWLADTLPELENETLHVLVKSASLRCPSKHVCCHVMNRQLPEGCFYRYSDELFIASPPFAFLQLATSCNVSHLAALGDEICGRYSFDPHSERGFRMRKIPLLTRTRLTDFIDVAGICGLPGVKRARKALRFVVEGAESPMESAVHLLLSLPYRYGGYGVDGLLFNCEVKLTPDARAIARRRVCRADILLEGQKLDIEFAGKHDHIGPEALEKDRRRTNALAEMGYEIIELTGGQIGDLSAFELIALRIASRAGKRIEHRYRGPLPARIALRRELFDWNAAGGRLR